jgi:hypothetical protein
MLTKYRKNNVSGMPTVYVVQLFFKPPLALSLMVTGSHKRNRERARFGTYLNYYLLLAAQHDRQLVFTHRLGQRQALVVLAARYLSKLYTNKSSGLS